MFISIITVVFNGEKTIERTVQSILKQNFRDYEYIIQDGGSNDRTIDIVKSYETRFEGRLKVYCEKDNGIYDAMNRGICHAHGDYIWLVNADDYITDNALTDLYQLCSKLSFRQCVLSGRLNIIDADTLKLRYSSKVSTSEMYEKNCRKLKMAICHPATIVHSQIYNTIGVYDDRYYISADVDFCLRCYKSGVDVVFFDKIITNMTDAGISNQYPIKKNMHDCCLRTSKFCTNVICRIVYTIWFFFRLIALKLLRCFA